MKVYLKRLIWRTETERFHPLMHTFLFVTLVFGLAYVLPAGIFGLIQSPLYEFSAMSVHKSVPFIWGGALLLTTALNTVTLATRWRFIGGITAMLGFLSWLYAAFAYFMVGYWLGFLAIALPNVFFWLWYYTKVKAYHRQPPANVPNS